MGASNTKGIPPIPIIFFFFNRKQNRVCVVFAQVHTCRLCTFIGSNTAVTDLFSHLTVRGAKLVARSNWVPVSYASRQPPFHCMISSSAEAVGLSDGKWLTSPKARANDLARVKVAAQ